MDELTRLEKTGEYLFHGSSSPAIDMFEPRQPISHGEKDGAPCVVAAELVEPAIFMAVLGSKKLGGWESEDDGQVTYFLTKKEFAQAKREKWAGYVYVLDRDMAKFNSYMAWEWRAHIKAKPVSKVKVGIKDLPENILLLDTYDQMAGSGAGFVT